MTQQKSERKDNKKTVVIVALLLALIALLCFGGYTFSKYVTSGNGTGTANVAKWGFDVEVDATNVFGPNYKYDGGASKVTAETTGLTVKADSAGRNLVAPGTTGSMTFTVKGVAEVKAKLNIEFTASKDVVLKIKKGDAAVVTYNPVKWTLKKGGDVLVNAGTLAAVKTELDKADNNPTYEAGTLVAETTYTLSWAWAFEGSDVVTGFTVNELDTILGRISNNPTYAPAGCTVDATTCTEIEFSVKVSVEQLAE